MSYIFQMLNIELYLFVIIYHLKRLLLIIIDLSWFNSEAVTAVCLPKRIKRIGIKE